MKKKLLQTLMLLLAAWMLPACAPSGVEDNPDDGGDPEGTDNIVLELQLERDAAVVSFEETARIGFSLRVYGLEDSQKLHGIEDLQIEYSTMAHDDLYDLQIEPDDETSGTLTITGKTPDAGREDREVILLANSPLGYSAQAVVQLKRIECELLDAPEDNTYVAPVEGGTVEIDIRSNSKTLIPLVVEDEWVHYDPAQCSVSDGEYDLDFIHHHKLRIDPHTEGTDPRSSLIPVYLQSGDLLVNLLVRQEVNFAADGREMILLVRAAPANARTVYLPLDDIVACTVDWGDGSREQFERRYTYDNPISHVYAEAGEYKVTIRGQVNAVTSFGMPSGALDNCILAVEQWGNLGAEEIVLRDITTLERIAPDTEGAFAKIRNFDRTFLGCTGLTELPEGLFARAESAAIFEATFYECTGLTKLPEGLFEGADPITFDTTFGRCTSLTELPGGLFRGCSHASTFHRTFEECTGLTSLPGRLFIPCPMATTFQATFYNCTGLAALPEGLFAGNPEAVSFGGETDYHNGAGREDRGLFTNCTALTEIPEGLFAFNSKVTDLSMAFLGCSGIREIPAGLFAALPELENLEYVFEGCKQIEEIPSGLFDNNPLLQEMYPAFCGCSSLRRLPTDLFDNNRLIRSFGYTFLGCEALEGESPYTEIGGRKYHLYERSENSVEFTPPDGYGCFGGCTKLSDYEEIPEAWR